MPSTRLLDCALATFTVARPRYQPPATQTDAWQFQGGALVQTKFRYIRITGVAVLARQLSVDLIKRSTADTGGTPTTVTPQKMDSSDAAAATGCKEFAAVPTPLGTAIGTVLASSIAITPDTFAAGYSGMALLFPGLDASFKPITLNGVAEFLCINLAGVATVNTDKIDLEAIFTEQ
jgi:hypothetical protein